MLLDDFTVKVNVDFSLGTLDLVSLIVTEKDATVRTSVKQLFFVFFKACLGVFFSLWFSLNLTFLLIAIDQALQLFLEEFALQFVTFVNEIVKGFNC